MMKYPDENLLDRPIRFVKGVGEKIGALLYKKKIEKVEDALYFFPRSYEDRRKIWQISELTKPVANICVLAKVKRAYPVSYSRSRRRTFNMIAEDLENPISTLTLTWFQKPHAIQKLNPGTLVMLQGDLQLYRGQLQMVHPEIEVLGKNIDSEIRSPGIIPVYSQTEGLYQKTIRKIEKEVATKYSSELKDMLPQNLLDKHDLPNLQEAVYRLHCPSEETDFDELVAEKSAFHRRMIYGEFFLFSLGMALSRKSFVENKGIAFSKPLKTWPRFGENLGFKFTAAQKRVLSEVTEDMCREKVMYRMVQGDVGSGKTAVAGASALVALESGYQVALMAPTEVLIEQHYRKFEEWFSGMDIPIYLLKGGMPAAEKKKVLEAISKNSPSMVFGTHALFEDAVKFKKLGFVIVDEQHRFGVRQRARLIDKGNHPDVLVMTATPIPRTLALTIYGDLDVSVIDELPPGRKPIKTKVFVDRDRAKMELAVQEQLAKGRQAYIVFPLIDESEKLALSSIQKSLPHLSEVFSDYKIEILHGRMPAEEKQQVLDAFRRNEIQLLVSTTVIEVGVDVPNATLMIVENAERFGLSQLHQLRGRVGRGSHESFCYLMASHLGSQEILKRLKAMEKTQDGFKLSEVDLEMRGPGEFLGTKQSGIPAFRVARLPRDMLWLQKAREDAFKLVEDDAELASEPKLKALVKKEFESLHLS